MMDPLRWVNTLPNSKIKVSDKKEELDPNVWLTTLPKKEKKYSFIKYSLFLSFFLVGLISVSLIKNETRNVQKEIDLLRSSINNLQADLHKSILEYEVLSSPENLSKLAKEHLNVVLQSYNRDQINKYNNTNNTISDLVENNEETIITASLYKTETKKNPSTNKIKISIKNKINEKKNELKKLEELYNNPKKIPKEVKNEIATKIEKTKLQLKELYNSPKKIITEDKVQRWAAIQVVKVFLGIPVIPGK